MAACPPPTPMLSFSLRFHYHNLIDPWKQFLRCYFCLNDAAIKIHSAIIGFLYLFWATSNWNLDYDESLLPLCNDAGQVLQVLSSTQLPASSIRTCCISRRSVDVVNSFEQLLCRSVIFSGGSKGQLFAWRLAVSNDNAFSDCFLESLGMYSICTKSRRQLKPWKQHLYNPEVETRFMHLSAFCLDDVMGQSWSHFHVVVAVCSVGIVRQAAILCYAFSQ